MTAKSHPSHGYRIRLRPRRLLFVLIGGPGLVIFGVLEVAALLAGGNLTNLSTRN